MKKLASLLPVVALLVTAPGLAHHSYAMFDTNKTLVLEATIVRFKWQNPHAFIETDVAAGRERERWAIEMTSPNNLVQTGWKRTSLRPGDRVRLYVHPLRAGARGGSYVGVRFADGSSLGDVD
ncbi:MAG: DUF6152 family protein [Croceibacterium sp.]